MAKTKKKKKSKAGPIAVGVAALAVIGALSPSEEEPNVEDITPPAIVEEAPDPVETPVEELIEEPDAPVEEAPPVVVAPPADPPAVEEPVVETPAEIPPEEPAQPEPEIDPEQAFREKLMQYNYVGSRESDRYHYPYCGWTKSINDQNLIHFDTEEEATAAGYSPCKSCDP